MDLPEIERYEGGQLATELNVINVLSEHQGNGTLARREPRLPWGEHVEIGF